MRVESEVTINKNTYIFKIKVRKREQEREGERKSDETFTSAKKTTTRSLLYFLYFLMGYIPCVSLLKVKVLRERERERNDDVKNK